MRERDNVNQKIIEISFKERVSSNGMFHKKSIAEKRSYAKKKYAKQDTQRRRCHRGGEKESESE